MAAEVEAVEHRVLHVRRLEQPQPQLPERWALRSAVCSRLLLARRAALHSAVQLRQAARRPALDSAVVLRQLEACSERAQAAQPFWLSLRTQPRRAHSPRREAQRTGRRQ